jgi:hypothetical protein
MMMPAPLLEVLRVPVTCFAATDTASTTTTFNFLDKGREDRPVAAGDAGAAVGGGDGIGWRR